MGFLDDVEEEVIGMDDEEDLKQLAEEIDADENE